MRRGMDEKCHGTTWRRDATNATGNQCLMCKVSFGSAGPDVVLDVRLPGLSSTSPRVKREPSTFHRLQSQAIVPSSPIDLDETPPRKKKARQNAIKQEQKEPAQPMSNLTMGVINLLSDDENPGHSFAVPANQDLDIEGMETEEDVFNFGNWLDEGDCH